MRQRSTRGRLAVAGLATVALVTGGLTLASSPASALTATDARTAALNSFRAELASQKDAGESTSLASFDALGESERTELARYLTGETSLSATAPPADAAREQSGSSVVATAGNARWVSTVGEETEPDDATGRATTYKVHSYADETFTLVGITISKTRVWADYTTGSGIVKSLTDYGCQLVSNYDPFSSISVSKQSAILSGGKATYKCYVTVKRGVPSPWGQISTTTRSAYQYMQVSGPGVGGHGWS